MKSSVTALTVSERQLFASNRVFTTGQVSRLLCVAPRTVSKWFDAGKLSGVRLPGSLDRRIQRDVLVEFCREWGFKAAGETLAGLEGPEFVLACGLPRVVGQRVEQAVSKDPTLAGCDLRFTDDIFDIADMVNSRKPDVLIVHTNLGRSLVRRIVAKVLENETRAENSFKPMTRIVVMMDVMDETDATLPARVQQLPDTGEPLAALSGQRLNDVLPMPALPEAV